MQGEAPGAGYGPHAGNGPHTQQSVPDMPSAPLPAAASFAPPPRRTSRLAVLLSALAIGLAAAALIVLLVRKPESPAPIRTPSTPTAAVPVEVFNKDADRSLCEAIVALMRENEDRGKQFTALEAGSPDQGAAIPGYRSFVEDWARRTQEVLNKYAEPPRYLTRTLQRFIDDKLLYVEMVRPGREDKFDAPTWQQAAIDYGGPLGTCRDVGVTW